MENYQHWEICMKLIEEGRIDESVSHANDIAEQLSVPKELIDRINAVNLKSFEKRIESKMSDCIQRAHSENAEALCLYYSLDNGWDSTMYVCKDFSPDSYRWISASRSWIDIGKARGFAGIYKHEAESAFFCDDVSSGICLLLMLRTTIAFYNVAMKHQQCGLILCITGTESDFVRIV